MHIKLLTSKIKQLTKVSSVLFLLISPTTNLFAVEVYNKDNTSLSVYGKLAFSISSTNKDYADYTLQSHSSRLGFTGYSNLNESYKSVFQLEYGINPFVQPSNGDGLKNRLGYVGIEYKNKSKFYVGRQWGTFYDIAEYTDWFNVNGGEAHVNFDDGADGGVGGTGRANSAVYRFDGDKIHLGGQILFHENTSKTVTRNYGVGVSARYYINPKFQFGLAYNFASLEDNNRLNIDNPIYSDKSQVIGGIRYDGDRYVFAFTMSYDENAYSANDAIATESYIGFKYKETSNDIIYLGHVQTTELSDHYDSVTNENLGKAVQRLYLTVGIQKEIFMPNFISYTEFKYDLRSQNQKNNAIITEFEDFQGTNNKLSFGFSYKF